MKTCPTCGGITEAVWGEGMGGIPCTCNDKPIYEQHIEDTVNFGGSKIIILQLQQENQALRELNERLNTAILKEQERTVSIEVLFKSAKKVTEGVWADHERQFAVQQSEITRLREALKDLLAACPHEAEGEQRAMAALKAREALAPQEGKRK